MITKIPNVNFQVRVRDDSMKGDNTFKWETKSTDDYFKNKKVSLFSLPGAFTPTCSTFQLPDFDKLYDEFKTKYKNITDSELQESIVVYLLCKIMRNKDLRTFSIKTIDNIYSDERKDFFQELENFIDKKQLKLE